jgi:hypothetical protein
MLWKRGSEYDLTGRKFGRLTVTGFIPAKGRKYWRCVCSCGRRTKSTANNLRRGSVSSCGCRLGEHSRKKPFEWLYNTMRKSARTRGWKVSLTYKQFVRYTTVLRCYYCKGEVTWNSYSCNNLRGSGSRSYNLDRMDDKKGYTKHNVVVCCGRCNRAKSNLFTFAEWVAVGRVIQRFAKRR